MYGKVNPSGTTERYGLIQTRLDFFLESGDVRYNDPRFYQIDQSSRACLRGYKGKVDEFGSPLDPEAYAAWEASLPRVWLAERCFHHHFIYLDPCTLRDEQITSAMGLHAPNFYKAWTEEWDKVQGGMRHGWDVACRKPRPARYNLKEPELYDARKAECLAKVDILKVSPFATQVTETGETFPSTDIDVGSEATDRASGYALSGGGGYGTIVSKNNPANETGTLDTVDAYFSNAQATNEVKVGTFSFSGTTGTCRDAQSLGNVSAGAQQFTGLDIDITSGDYIGADGRVSSKTVTLDVGTSGGAGVLTALTQQYCDPADSGTFTLYDADAILSLYGTGETGANAYSETAALTLGVAAGASKSWGTARQSATGLGVAATASRVHGFVRASAIALGIAATATRAVTYNRTAALSLGITSLGSRIVTYLRSSAVALGLAATASKLRGFVRTSAVSLGIAATATRLAVRGRTSALALGVAATATRVWGTARTSAVSLGLALTASRAVASQRTSTLVLGIASLGSRAAAFGRSSAVAIGVAATASRIHGFVRTSAVSLGITSTASRLAGFARSSSVSLGVALTALGEYTASISHFFETANLALGVAVSAVRKATYGRTSNTALGLAATATRQIVYARLSAVALGVAAVASRTRTAERLSQLSLGVASTASRLAAYARTSALSLGLTVAVDVVLPVLYYLVTAALSLGVALSAARNVIYHRTSATGLGMAADATRALAYQRTSELSAGIAATASRAVAYGRTAALAVGVTLSAVGQMFRTIIRLILKLFRRDVTIANRDISLTLQAMAREVTVATYGRSLVLACANHTLTLRQEAR